MQVLKPFPAYSYFFGNGGIYFSVPTETGDLELKRFDAARVRPVEAVSTSNIAPEELAGETKESVFYSFPYDYSSRGLLLSSDPQHPALQYLTIRGKKYLAFTQGNGIKGSYFCSTRDGAFLPGDRYVVLTHFYCGNYTGELLLDTDTGLYEHLPLHTRVYVTENTQTRPDYRITVGGIVP